MGFDSGGGAGGREGQRVVWGYGCAEVRDGVITSNQFVIYSGIRARRIILFYFTVEMRNEVLEG